MKREINKLMKQRSRLKEKETFGLGAFRVSEVITTSKTPFIECSS